MRRNLFITFCFALSLAKGQKPDAINFRAYTFSEFRTDSMRGYSIKENYLPCVRKTDGSFVAENIFYRGKVFRFGKDKPNYKTPPWKKRETMVFIKESSVTQLVSMSDSDLYDREVFVDTLGSEPETWRLFKSEAFILKNLSVDSFGYSAEQLSCICESAKQKPVICSHQSDLNGFIAQLKRETNRVVRYSSYDYWVEVEICYSRDTTFLRLFYPNAESINWRVSYSHSPTEWWLLNPRINELLHQIIPAEVTDRSHLLSFKNLFLGD